MTKVDKKVDDYLKRADKIRLRHKNLRAANYLTIEIAKMIQMEENAIC